MKQIALHGPLEEVFSDLFSLCRIPDAFIEDWSLLGWNIPFRRVLNDQEVDRITEFFKVLDMFKGTTDAGDSMIWKGWP